MSTQQELLTPLLTTLATRLGAALLAKHWTITTAESCTGGGLAAVITSITGSSAWYDRGFITYSNAAKMDLLNVSSQLLEEFGAVSEPVAKAMADGALKNATTQIALSITGIAGPTGGTPEKPVGIVCFGLAQKNNSTQMMTQYFQGDRDAVRQQAVLYGLEFILGGLRLTEYDLQ